MRKIVAIENVTLDGFADSHRLGEMGMEIRQLDDPI